MPEIITGARDPESVASGRAASAKKGSALSAIPAGKRVFTATALKYRRTFTSNEYFKLPDGTTARAKDINAKWDEGILVLDVVKDAELIKRMEADEWYGRDYFDLAEKLRQAEERKVEEAKKSLVAIAATPEGRAKLREALAAAEGDDFDLPGGKQKQASKPAA